MSVSTLPRISEVTSHIELVTPDLAREWLGMNFRNRHLKHHEIAAWARDMGAGKWRLTGEAIKFAVDGTLLDGQNRLNAIVLADVELPMLIVRGLEPEAQDVMDTGSKRTAGDTLTMHGEKNAALLSSAAAMIITEGGAYRRKVTTPEITQLVGQDDSIRMIVNDVLPSLKLGTILSGSVACYAYWRLHQVDADKCAEFFQSLSSLTNLQEGSPVLALHRRLLRTAESSGKGSWSYRREALACIFSAWNAYGRRERRAKIQLTYGVGGRVQIPEPREPRP